MGEIFEGIRSAMSIVLMLVGAATTLFGAVLLLLWLSGHVAFIRYIDEDEDDATN